MQNTSVQLNMFDTLSEQSTNTETLAINSLSLLDRLAKISHWQENEVALRAKNQVLSNLPSFLSNGLNLVYISGKTLKEHSAATMAQTFGQLSKPLPTLGVIQSNGNCLIHCVFTPK